MHQRTDLIYAYDGSFYGLMCCVFESFVSKERPLDIVSSAQLQPSLMSVKWITTDDEKARRVLRGIGSKLSSEAMYLVKNAFYCCGPMELMVLDFLTFAFSHGKNAAAVVGAPEVHAIQKAVLYQKRESHFYVEIIRFSEYSGGLVSVIEPKNIVLPTIAPHFCNRLPNELFLIYDKTHLSALIHKPNRWVIANNIEDFIEPEADDSELFYRELWGSYFDAIAIRERANPACQRNHLPMRYRNHMTEFVRQSGRGASSPPALSTAEGRFAPPKV